MKKDFNAAEGHTRLEYMKIHKVENPPQACSLKW